MYAVIDIGGKQFKVKAGDSFEVDRLAGAVGDTVEFKTIFSSNESGISTEPAVAKAEILAHGKGKKIVIFKYKPKKNIRKKQGHRQALTKIKIISIA